MPAPGTPRSPARSGARGASDGGQGVPRPSATAARTGASKGSIWRAKKAAVCLLLCTFALPAQAQGISEPLTDTPGDPERGRAIVADRQVGLCVLCHQAPLPEVPFMGNLAPDLAGAGSRLTVPELRERIVDSRRVNPDTIMPPYHSLEDLDRVGERWRGDTILSAQKVEDVVAYLATLTEDGAQQ